MRLVTTQEAMKDFRVDLRDFGQADLVRLFGVLSTRGGRATKVDFKLQNAWIRCLDSKSRGVVYLVLATAVGELQLAGGK